MPRKEFEPQPETNLDFDTVCEVAKEILLQSGHHVPTIVTQNGTNA